MTKGIRIKIQVTYGYLFSLGATCMGIGVLIGFYLGGAR
jgi:hypothetical protein